MSSETLEKAVLHQYPPRLLVDLLLGVGRTGLLAWSAAFHSLLHLQLTEVLNRKGQPEAANLLHSDNSKDLNQEDSFFVIGLCCFTRETRLLITEQSRELT